MQTVDTAYRRVAEIAQVEQLLSMLSPAPNWPADPRRFYCLRDLLDGDAKAANQHTDETVEELRKLLINRSRILDPYRRLQSLRALAILHWEWALAAPVAQRASREIISCYDFATFLWRHILTDKMFWSPFSEEHLVAKEHLDQVRQRVLDDILIHHIEGAKEHHAVARADISQFHLNCLGGWASAPPAYSTEGSRPGTEFDKVLGEEIQARADAVVNGWVSSFLQAATSRLKDPQALLSLPQGISRNFEGALDITTRALDVLPDKQRLLSFAVRQGNDYT